MVEVVKRMKRILNSLRGVPESDDPRVLNDSGLKFIQENKLEKAVRYLDKATMLDPNYKEAWYNKGQALYALKYYKKGQSSYEKAVEIDANYIDPLIALAEIEFSEKNLEKAIELYKHVYSLDETYSDSILKIAESYSLLENYEKAQEYYEKVLITDPNNLEYQFDYAKTLGENDLDAGIEVLDQILQKEPRHYRALLFKGIFLEKKMELFLAKECFEKILNECPPQIDIWQFAKQFHQNIAAIPVIKVDSVEQFKEVISSLEDESSVHFPVSTDSFMEIKNELQRIIEEAKDINPEITTLEKKLAQKSLQSDLSDPETKKWILWFIRQEEKHVQGDLSDESYWGMLQRFENFLLKLQSTGS